MTIHQSSDGEPERPSHEEPLCGEDEFVQEVRELVADEAPRVFALVEEYGERDDGGVTAGIRPVLGDNRRAGAFEEPLRCGDGGACRQQDWVTPQMAAGGGVTPRGQRYGDQDHCCKEHADSAEGLGWSAEGGAGFDVRIT